MGLAFWNAKQSAPEPEQFNFGLGGGWMMSGGGYSPGTISFADSFGRVKSLGGDTVRLTVESSMLQDDGTVTNIPRFEGALSAAKAAGLKIILCLRDRMFSSVWSGTEQEAFDAGYALANGFCDKYGDQIGDMIELTNEPDLFRDLRKVLNPDGSASSTEISGTGTDRAHYNSRFENAVQYIAGMEAGVKAVPPYVQTIFNTASWNARYLFDAVFSAAPTIDHCGIHWYHEMHGQFKQGNYPGGTEGTTNIIDFAFSRWGKPVWVTEANARWDNRGTSSDDEWTDEQRESRQLSFFQEFYPICRNDNRCAGYIIHELYTDVGSDDNYGIFELDENNDPVPHQLASYLLSSEVN